MANSTQLRLNLPLVGPARELCIHNDAGAAHIANVRGKTSEKALPDAAARLVNFQPGEPDA